MTEKRLLAEVHAMLTRIEAALGLQQNEVRRHAHDIARHDGELAAVQERLRALETKGEAAE